MQTMNSPIETQPVNPALPGAAGQAEPADSRAGTLLLVDDEASILSALKRLFRPHGYRVLTSESGMQALEILAQEPVDLIISDMRMPAMNGARFLAEARRSHPEAIRILLTGYSDISSTIEAINAGEIHRYIAKPWDDREIVLIVREALERKALEREKARLEALTQRQNEELKALNASLEVKVAERTAELQQAHEKLKASFLNSIKLFSNLLELRAASLAGHSRRVAEYSRRMAQSLKLSPAETQDIFIAALLHDIGKIGLPDALLTKPFNALRAEERSEVVKHPAKAQGLLMGLEQLRTAATLIHAHHERFDGLGYPDQLCGMAIPLGARILAVANDYDAIQHGLISNKRASPEEAWAYLQGGRGKRYDPQVLDAFQAAQNIKATEPAPRGIAIESDRLVPGMALAQDLVTREGVLLLARDYLLDQNLIDQVRKFEAAEGYRLTIRVQERRT